MRLFIGIELDDGLKKYIDHRKESIKPYIKTGRFTDRNNLHLTLKFIGEVREDVMVQITEKLQKMEASQRCLNIHLDHLGVFPKKNKAILWLGIQENEAIIKLYNRIEDLMEECGLEKEKRLYTPHITLGRGVRFNESFEVVRDAVHFKHECIHVQSITLFESTRVKGKLTYVPLMKVPLK